MKEEDTTTTITTRTRTAKLAAHQQQEEDARIYVHISPCAAVYTVSARKGGGEEEGRPQTNVASVPTCASERQGEGAREVAAPAQC